MKNQFLAWRRRLKWLLQMIARGNFRLLAIDFSLRVYRAAFHLPFWLRVLRRKSRGPSPEPRIELQTKFPVAFESPDHLVPWGTMNDNSTNRKFVLFMDHLVRSQRDAGPYAFMDLGCSGGQLVRDFKDLSWTAVGLEGSDYSLKHRRANWPKMAGKNLFTCDITKPFQVLRDQRPLAFDLITAWEVLEHVPPSALDQLFRNIAGHLRPGGYFIASTTSVPDFHDGVDLHQSKFSNQQWRELITTKAPDLQHVDLHLKFYQFVRYNFEERSFLTCKKSV